MNPILLTPSDISIAASLIILDAALSMLLKLRLHRQIAIAAARMVVQLVAIGYVLRFIFALNTSLHVLQPHRVALRALIPVLVGDPDDGVFAAGTAFSRQRVERVFEEA